MTHHSENAAAAVRRELCTDCRPSANCSSGNKPKKGAEHWLNTAQCFEEVRNETLRAQSPERGVPLIPFCDLHEPVLYELGYSRHGVHIDLDVGKQVFISPMVDSRGGPA